MRIDRFLVCQGDISKFSGFLLMSLKDSKNHRYDQVGTGKESKQDPEILFQVF